MLPAFLSMGLHPDNPQTESKLGALEHQKAHASEGTTQP